MAWGKIFCPSDTLMQISRRDLFFIPRQCLLLHQIICFSRWSHSAAWKFEHYWSSRT